MIVVLFSLLIVLLFSMQIHSRISQQFEMPSSLAIRDVTSHLKAVSTHWPYSLDDFRREDESSDRNFYSSPRLVYHIDEGAVSALTKFYELSFESLKTHLDICSSWVSHYPNSIVMGKSVGLGMNDYELSRNAQLTEYIVQDLNLNPIIPRESNSVDYVTCVVSIDYLIRPLEVMREINRLLKPGGVFIISQSNRYFPSKVIRMWLDSDDISHLSIIRDYFHFAGGFKNIVALDISALSDQVERDPMYIVQGVKE